VGLDRIDGLRHPAKETSTALACGLCVVNVICRADQNVLVVDAVASKAKASSINDIRIKLFCRINNVLMLHSMSLLIYMENTESIKRSPLQVALDPGLREKLDEVAQREGISLAEVFRRAFIFYYASQS
jgi:Ribbon-helix-helix protein, copG family